MTRDEFVDNVATAIFINRASTVRLGTACPPTPSEETALRTRTVEGQWSADHRAVVEAQARFSYDAADALWRARAARSAP
jgi:hypothetical protein